jgi:putative peptidoglycan lipid II flippase
VFGIAIATVILPSLSRIHAEKSPERFAHTLDWAIRMILLIGLPAALALAVLAEPLIATLFHYGEMTDRDVQMAAMSLRAYAFGLLAFMLIKVLAPGYFARQNTRTPVKIAVKAMAANMVLNLILIWPLDHVGLALATSISAFMNAGWLLHGLIKEGVFRWQPGWAMMLFRLVSASITLVAVLLLIMNWLAGNWLEAGVWLRVQWMTVLVLAGAGAYLLMLLVTGLRLRHLRG